MAEGGEAAAEADVCRAGRPRIPPGPSRRFQRPAPSSSTSPVKIASALSHSVGAEPRRPDRLLLRPDQRQRAEPLELAPVAGIEKRVILQPLVSRTSGGAALMRASATRSSRVQQRRDRRPPGNSGFSNSRIPGTPRLAVGERLAFERHHRAAGGAQHRVARRRVPFHGRPEARIEIRLRLRRAGRISATSRWSGARRSRPATAPARVASFDVRAARHGDRKRPGGRARRIACQSVDLGSCRR